MWKSLRSELWAILPAWFACSLIPLPAIIFRSLLGQWPLADFCFLICCMSFVASRFRPKVISQQPWQAWHVKILAVGMALVASVIVFSVLWLCLADVHDFITP